MTAPQPRYRYLLTDLMSGLVLSEGRGLTVSSYSRRLNGPGECAATLNVASEVLRRTDNPLNATEPRRTVLWIIRNEVLVWGGLIWTRPYQSGTAEYQLRATSLESYLARRRIRTTYSYRGIDQHLILWDLVRLAQAVPNGDIGIITENPASSGRLRDRTYAWHERATYLERIQQLCDVIDGPDFTLEPGWQANGRPAVTLKIGSPLGTPNPTTVIEYPGQVRNYAWTDDGGDSANFWTAIGDAPTTPDDAPPIMRDASMPSEWAAGYPLLEDVSDHQGVTDAATLDGYARANVAAAAGNRVVPELTLRPTSEQLLPGLGDSVSVRVTDPYRFPADPQTGAPGAATTVRITGWTVHLSAGEGETLSATLTNA